MTPVRHDLPSGTVTFLFTDIEGSTRLLRELEAANYAQALAEHRRILREAFGAHGGVEVDTQGDAFFVAFPTAPGALRAAAEALGRLATGPIRVRMGIHTGTPHAAEEGYVGVDVHRAARIAAVGHGGQVLVSASTAALLDTDRLRDLGEHRLKDLSAPERIYQLGDDDFAPLTSLHQTNLPIPSTPFLGREKELTEVLGLMTREDIRLLTLTGPGGTGKTRLGLQAAGEIADLYRNGVWWVPLAPLRDPQLVLETAGQALGATDGLAEHIADKAMLLLFDNFEQVVEAAGDVARLLASCPNLDLLLTSREPLHVAAEQEYAVPPLAHDEGVGLFLSRARAIDLGFQADEAVSEICRRLDELPLALELAAARVKALSSAQILERLDQRLPLLTGGARDLPERQRTLRTTIEWSYELLAPDEQRLFARLAVFSGGCTLEAGEKVAEADLDRLQSLVDKSLLRHTQDRFWMLETIREYAAERLEECGETSAMRMRHAAWCVSLAEEAEPELTGEDQARWWKRLTDEYDNVRAALGWLCAGGNPALALHLTASLWRFWWQRGPFREAQRWYEAALASGASESAELRARAVYGAANMALGMGDLPEAIRMLEDCLSVFRRVDDRTRAGYALNDLGIAYSRSGRLAEARALHEEAIDLALSRGDERSAAVIRTNLAYLLIRQGELDEATELLIAALTPIRQSRDEQSVASALENLALIDVLGRKFHSAENQLRESIVLSRLTDDKALLAHSLIVAAAVVAAKGDVTAAVSLLSASESLSEDMNLALDDVEKLLFESTLEEMRAALSTDSFDAAWNVGQSLESEDLFDRTLQLLD
jgi:predicted ATPase/class 3 adenylate cyclase/Flp pilus assembly protein TadD